MRDAIYRANDAVLVRDRQRLTASDHFHVMGTAFSDGDAHEHLSSYESPCEAYITFMNVVDDLALRLDERDAARSLVEEPPQLARSAALAIA